MHKSPSMEYMMLHIYDIVRIIENQKALTLGTGNMVWEFIPAEKEIGRNCGWKVANDVHLCLSGHSNLQSISCFL